MFLWLSSLWRKIVWVAKLIYVYVKPIYPDLIAIMKKIKAEGLKDEEARKKVFQMITDVIHKKGLAQYPDSILNAANPRDTQYPRPWSIIHPLFFLRPRPEAPRII